MTGERRHVRPLNSVAAAVVLLLACARCAAGTADKVPCSELPDFANLPHKDKIRGMCR